MTLEMDNLPPFDEESLSLPERDVRSWYLVLYTHPFMRWYSNGDVWDLISSYREEDFRLKIKPSSAIRKQAQTLVAGATTDEEKLARLYDFCRSTVSNLDYFDSAELQAQKKALDNRDGDPSPEWTMEHHVGYRRHVNQLFASLAKAAGFEVKVALSASRDVTLQVKNPNGWIFLDDELVEVKRGPAWKPYSPGDYYVPSGMIARKFELADSFRCDGDKGLFEPNPVSPASASLISRKGRFTLDADGNLEGDVEVEMTGHTAVEKKVTWRSLTPQEIDEDYRTSVTSRLPAAMIENLTFENSGGIGLPLRAKYHLKVPGYADVAGSKIILVPSVFAHGKPAVFASDHRKTPIMFDYAWSEHDDIEIVLPEGFVLDAPSAPQPAGDPAEVAGVRYFVSYKGKTRALVYRRDFALGGNAVTAFLPASYPALKELLDKVDRSDEHTLVLKPHAAAAPAPAVPAAAPAATGQH